MRIIFDIGGTNTRISSIKNSEVSEIKKFSTPQDLEIAKKKILETIKEIDNGEKIESIVGGVAGTIQDGVIKNSPNLPNWNNFEFEKFLSENICPESFVYNDSDLAGLGESVYGSGKDYPIVAYLGIGTGIGGVRIINKEIDKNNLGFEPGHHMIGDKQFEDIVSGKAILNLTGKKPEEAGEEVYNNLLHILAEGVYNTIIFWSPDILIIGGSLINDKTGFKIENLKQEVIKLGTNIPIKKSALADNSGLWGAVYMTNKLS